MLLDDFPAAARVAGDPGALAVLGAELARADRVVVILGASIPGLVLAARLAAHARVVLVTGPPPVPKRLVNGCSLRRSTIEILGRALGCGADRIVERCGGRAATFAELRIACAEGRDGAVELEDDAVAWRSPRMIGLSTRHGAILSALRAELVQPVTLVPGEVPRDGRLVDGALPLVVGGERVRLPLPRGRAVILNATPFATLLRPGRALPPPERYVVAVQAPMRPSKHVGPGSDVAIAPVLAPDGHLAFYTPFADAHTPEATWYGINTFVVPAPSPDVTAAVRARLFAMGAALGLEPAGGDAARGEATVPVIADRAAMTQARLDDGQPIVDVGRAFTSGAPAINVDGMLAGARGAEAFAAAFAQAPEPAPLAAAHALDAVDEALAPVRWRNRATEWFFFFAPERLRRACLALTGPPAARLFVEDFAALGESPRG